METSCKTYFMSGKIKELKRSVLLILCLCSVEGNITVDLVSLKL